MPKVSINGITAWKVFVMGGFLVRIFPYSDWIRRDMEYLSVSSPNAGKYGPEKFWIQTHFTQWIASVITYKTCLHCQLKERYSQIYQTLPWPRFWNSYSCPIGLKYLSRFRMFLAIIENINSNNFQQTNFQDPFFSCRVDIKKLKVFPAVVTILIIEKHKSQYRYHYLEIPNRKVQ